MEIPVQPPIQPPAQPPTPQPPIIQPTPPIQQPTPPIQPIPQTPPSSPPSPKSQKGLFIPIAIIILMVIFGTFVYLMTKPSPPTVDILVSPSPTQRETQTDTNKDNALLPTGTNDIQLEKDMQSIDTKIGTAESDLGTVDQGLNDQSVNLTE